jgi:hypothetical protein
MSMMTCMTEIVTLVDSDLDTAISLLKELSRHPMDCYYLSVNSDEDVYTIWREDS